MSKQIKVRRDTASNLATVTPADAEIAYDTTNDRLNMGDGTSAGGVPHINFKDGVNNVFASGVAGGSANALTVTLAKAPGSNPEFQKVLVRATAANTGAATLAVNGGTAFNIQKISGGTLSNLSAGDIVSGAIHEFVKLNSTNWLLLNPNPSAGLVSVSQGNLNTSIGSVSKLGSSGSAIQQMGNLAGGEYAFGFTGTTSVVAPRPREAVFLRGTASNSSSAPVAYLMRTGDTSGTATFVAYERYITSSPPFDLGDGDANGFLFLLINKDSTVENSYFADAPPWAYNGKTNIRAEMVCSRTGKKFRKVQRRSLEEMMNGAEQKIEYEEITMALKNRDMEDIPHPFPFAKQDQTVVLVDPMDDRIASLISHQNAGGMLEISDAIHRGLIYCDNEPLKRAAPAGVMVGGLRFKYSGKGKKK